MGDEKAKETSHVSTQEVRSEEPFYPFQHESERQEVNLHRRAGFPIVGVCALAMALGLIVLSAVVLILVQGPGKVVSDWTVRVWHTSKHFTFPKPAAILSILLSFISIGLHIALSEGANVAWWYRATRRGATVKDLHTMWAHGSSTGAAAKAGAVDVKRAITSLFKPAEEKSSRRAKLTYLALATLFVATIPVNGVLLQNAVIVRAVQRDEPGSFSVPMATDSIIMTGRYGFAGNDVAPEAYWTSTWAEVVAKGVNTVNTFAKIVDFNTTCRDTCSSTVNGFGFDFQCDNTPLPYDIPAMQPNPEGYMTSPVLPQAMVDTGATVFNISFTSDQNVSNGIFLDMIWKNQQGCQGSFMRSRCTLRPALLSYPIVVKAGAQDLSQASSNYTLMMLNPNVTLGSPTSLGLVRGPLVAPETLMVGAGPVLGWISLFESFFSASARLTYNQNYETGCYAFDVKGSFAKEMIGLSDFDTLAMSFINNGTGPTVCNGAFEADVGSKVISGLQRLTFLASAYTPQVVQAHGSEVAAPMDGGNPAYVNATYFSDWVPEFFEQHPGELTWTENQYAVEWVWYFASLAVTLVVALAIAPTFWGFWTLDRKTTMSPFDTARAFPAPALGSAGSDVRADALLKEVGSCKIRQDPV